MRLICPNCDAQYEVDDSVIPNEGRDVQCSSCGQTWFQKSAAQLEADGETPEDTKPAETSPKVEPESPSGPEPETKPESEPEAAQDTEAEQTPDSEQPTPRPTDESVLDILREEAALEVEARKQDVEGGLETQPDLGLSQASDADTKLTDSDSDDDKSTARRDLLPDIDEINSTLRAETENEASNADDEKPQGRSGFRLGFSVVLILATALLLIYIYAPQIIQKYPASESFMTGYVEKVNDLRSWLDQMMKSATDKMAGSSNG